MQDLVVLKFRWADDSDVLTQLRTRVFVEEQNVSAAVEMDGRDAIANTSRR